MPSYIELKSVWLQTEAMSSSSSSSILLDGCESSIYLRTPEAGCHENQRIFLFVFSKRVKYSHSIPRTTIPLFVFSKSEQSLLRRVWLPHFNIYGAYFQLFWRKSRLPARVISGGASSGSSLRSLIIWHHQVEPFSRCASFSDAFAKPKLCCACLRNHVHRVISQPSEHYS